MTGPHIPATAASSPKVRFISLGCAKALTDSELILTQLRAEGHRTSTTIAVADQVIVNTCGFIDSAVQESLDTIGEAPPMPCCRRRRPTSSPRWPITACRGPSIR